MATVPAMPTNEPAAKRRPTGIAVGDECPVCSQEIRPREVAFRRYTESPPLSTRDEIVDLLAAAIRILHYGKSDWERACWRVADALLLLGEKFPDAHGIAERTGRGAKLSRPARSPRR